MVDILIPMRPRRPSRHAGGLAAVLQALARALFDPYHPERHYMRGPGPKWHAKHDLPAVPEVHATTDKAVA